MFETEINSARKNEAAFYQSKLPAHVDGAHFVLERLKELWSDNSN